MQGISNLSSLEPRAVPPVRFAVFGAGFWSRFQLGAWGQLAGVKCVAIYNRSLSKATVLAADFGIPRVYEDAAMLLDHEELDFVDIITAPDTHAELVRLVAARGIPVVSQKPMAESLSDAEEMVAFCDERSVPFFVHENFRWQVPIRELKRVIDSGVLGRLFRARIEFSSAFPVFDNQPFLRNAERFILTDIGSHVLDVARFLFGEATDLVARIDRIHPDIRGEDVATVLLGTQGGVTVVCELSYASRLETEAFPETLVRVEGSGGSAQLTPGCWLRVTTEDGTTSRRLPSPRYSWADPAYDLIHASIVPCNANILEAIRGLGRAETTGADNLATVRLVFGSYESAASGQVLVFDPLNGWGPKPRPSQIAGDS